MRFAQQKIAVSLWCFFILCLMYWGSYLLQIMGKNFSISLFAYRFLGSFMLASIVFFLVFLPKRLGLFISWILIIASSIMLLVDIFCYFVFNSTLSEAMLATAIETNPLEISSFLELYFSPTLCLILFIVIFTMLFIVKKMKTYFIVHQNKMIKVFSFYILVCLVGCMGWGYEFFLFKREGYACEYRNELIFITPLRDLCFLNNARSSNVAQKAYVQKYREIFAHQSSGLRVKNNIEDIVLVLGESLRRDHMQIYGYAKPTSPLLKTYLSSNIQVNSNEGGGGGDIIIFKDVISPHAQTTLSLRKVLTYLNYENEKDMAIIYGYGNLISTFNLAGYTTFWISNQMDKNNGIVGTIASFATYNDFVSRFKQTFDDVFFDEEVLKSLDSMKSKKTQKNMYVIHLMGSHASYGNRYPKEYRVFDDSIFGGLQRTLSRYDNSVLYNDYVIDEIFKRFSQSDSIVIYISDHGEELYDNGDFLGHSDDRISKFMIEIPMLVFCSQTFIQKHPKLYQQLLESQKNPYMTDDLIHTILDIAGINVPSFDKHRSLINKDFNSKRVRMVGGVQGKDYDCDLK